MCLPLSPAPPVILSPSSSVRSRSVSRESLSESFCAPGVSHDPPERQTHLIHWAVYVGEGYVIHLAPPSEHALAGANSKMSVLHERATVKKGKLYVVVGNNDYHINNILDDKCEPRPIQEIVQDAHSTLTELRYGKPQSCQGISRGDGVPLSDS
uniref:LRAT domain-containing protein n=1 Tax=Sinocyclocheilus rhinocerous TaxID=307959 RepID=A0A673KGI6_9TELE